MAATVFGTVAGLLAHLIAGHTKYATPVVAGIECPDGNVRAQQGTNAGAADVNVTGGTLTATMDVSTLATGAKQDTGNAALAKIAPTSALLPATVAAKADSGVIKNTACSLYKVIAANSHASTTVYLQLFDSATVPADATAPRIPSIPIAPGKAIVIDLGATPLALAAGLSWASSSTVDTKTATAITPLQVSAVLA